MANKLQLILGYFFCISGVLFTALLIHEGIHVLQAENPKMVCIGIDGKAIASTTADSFVKGSEYWAYGISTLFVILAYIFIVFPLFLKKSN